VRRWGVEGAPRLDFESGGKADGCGEDPLAFDGGSGGGGEACGGVGG
jgi:hypothetical protein